MTRTEFLHQAAIVFASNSALAKEEFTTEHCTNIICDLAEKLTNKVAEKADFDPEYQ
jgi:hypothetical protein